MLGPHGVAGDEDAGKEHQEGADVGEGEDGPVYQAEDGSLAAPRCDIVRIVGTGRESGDAQLRAQPREP